MGCSTGSVQEAHQSDSDKDDTQIQEDLKSKLTQYSEVNYCIHQRHPVDTLV